MRLADHQPSSRFSERPYCMHTHSLKSLVWPPYWTCRWSVASRHKSFWNTRCHALGCSRVFSNSPCRSISRSTRKMYFVTGFSGDFFRHRPKIPRGVHKCCASDCTVEDSFGTQSGHSRMGQNVIMAAASLLARPVLTPAPPS